MSRRPFTFSASALVPLACLVAAVLALSAAAQDAMTVSDRRLFADGLFSRGLHARAAAEYEALATEFPAMEELDVVLFRWAEALRQANKPDEAGAVLLRIIRERPQSPYRLRAMFQRGALAISQDHHEAAAELLGALLDENPPADIREPALYYRAEALTQLNAVKDAIPLYETLLKEYPESAMAAYARLSLGRQLVARNGAGDGDRARSLFRACAEKPPTPRLGAEALYLLAQCDFAAGQYKASADAYLELSRRYPDDERTAATGLQSAWASHNAGLHAESQALAAKALADAAAPRRDEWLYLKASSEFQLTRYREAVETFVALTRDHADSRFSGAAWYQTSVAQQRLGDFAAATASALRVPANDPLRRDVLWLLGECYAALKDVDHAVQYYRLLTDEFPKDERAPEALYRLAHQLQSREAWTDASAAYLQLVERFADHALVPRALFASGFCLMKAGQSEKAVRDWNVLVQKFPKDETAHEALFRKGLEEIRLERHGDALASLDALLRGPADAPHVAEARFWRATLLHRKGDLPEAEKSLRDALAAQPPKDLEREASFLLGLVLQQAGRETDAAALFQKLVDDPLRTRFTPHQLAWLSERQFAQGAFAEAEAAARRLAEQAPDDAWKQAAWTLVGRAARGRKDAAAAESAFRSAVAIPGDTRYSAEAHLRIGELRLAAGDAIKAEPHFRTAAKLATAPDLQSIRIMAHAGLGRALRQSGDRDNAARYLLGVCLLYRDEALLPPLLEETIPLLRELGRTDEADALTKDLLEQYPNSAAAAKFAPPKQEGRAVSAHLHHEAPPEGRHAVAAAVAAVVSLILHVVLYETVGERYMASFDAVLGERQSHAKKHRVATQADIAPPPPPVPVDPLRTVSADGTGLDEASALLDRLAQPSAASIFEPPPAAPDKAMMPTGVEQFTPPPVPELPAWQPRQEILSILDAAARDHRAPIPRREIPAVERQSLAPDITTSYDLLAGLPKAAAAPAMPSISSPVAVSLAPPVASKGGDEALPELDLGPEAEGDTSTKLVAELPAAVAPAYPIEDRLRIAVTAFTADRADGYRYFRIDVARKDAQALPVLPRDVVFVQDTSASLGERYLNPCRVALREAIASLRPEDRFNIVRFSQDAATCFPVWASPNPVTLAQADAFAAAMTSGGNTDLFASMEEVLRLPRTEGRPVIAIVVTDGNVTAGQLERESQIIGTFSRLNAGEVSVFTVATTPRANVYLLEMLSYANRGSMTAVAEDRFSVTRTVREAQKSVERPLLAGVRFNFDVVSGAEVYPTLTTNLYEDRPLQLFGRVRADQPVVAFQARGEASGKRYDMLFEVDLAAEGVQPGARDLVRQWATQRMYDLVARFASTEDASLIADMHRLGAEFGIPVPYKSRLAP